MAFEDSQEEQVVEVEKIKVGEKEFTQDELSSLVGLGETARELESKWNTDITKIYPEFTRKSQRLSELEKEKESWEQEKNKKEEIPEDEQIRQAREAAKKVGLITADNFDEFMGKKFDEHYAKRRAGEKLYDEAGSLESKYNGEDGRPKFKREEILDFMRETGIRNPEFAYKQKYEPEIDLWREKQLQAARKGGMITESSSNVGGKFPSPVKVTKENLSEMMNKALDGEL